MRSTHKTSLNSVRTPSQGFKTLFFFLFFSFFCSTRCLHSLKQEEDLAEEVSETERYQKPSEQPREDEYPHSHRETSVRKTKGKRGKISYLEKTKYESQSKHERKAKRKKKAVRMKKTETQNKSHVKKRRKQNLMMSLPLPLMKIKPYIKARVRDWGKKEQMDAHTL